MIWRNDPAFLRLWLEHQMTKIPTAPEMEGDGIVLPAGGGYTLHALLNVRMLRQLGCKLPIEIWYLGEEERHEFLFAKLAELGCTFVDALDHLEEYEVRHPNLHGWELKAYAVKYSKFARIILLDADITSIKPLEYLFDCDPFRRTGLLIMRDQYDWHKDSKHWALMGLEPLDETQAESGVVVVDKRRNWDWVWIVNKLNEVGTGKTGGLWEMCGLYGDKDTFPLAAYLLKKPFAWNLCRMEHLKGTMCQFDWVDDSKPTFYHRNFAKIHWTDNEIIKDFPYESTLHEWVDEYIHEQVPVGLPYSCRGEYLIIKGEGDTHRQRVELNFGKFQGAGCSERFYTASKEQLKIYNDRCELTAVLDRNNLGWSGHWVVGEKWPCMIVI